MISAVYWYVEANGHAGLVDGSIIMIQTGLELIYNWLLIEQKKLIIGDDAANITSANKIRILLSEIAVSPGFFPDQYIDLKNADTIDAPDALVKIRNALAHGQEKKRMALLKIPSLTKVHALHLGIWYVELSLLKILGFNGLYKRRGSNDNTMLKCPVPWAK